ncbi:MAG: hypothetical protein GY795_38775 [Desulfobacterales bacterium]|nr:hypothetical protein [Desulfobacterales bacterium]
MNAKRDIQTWEISLISPLHVGDGEALQLNLDYTASRDGLKVIDPDSVFKSLRDNPRALTEMGRQGFDLERFARDYGIRTAPRYTLLLHGARAPDNLLAFIKNAFGQPYLPGTTLKGAVRTALWTSLDRSGLPDPSSNYWQFKKAVERLDGQDPHYDFMRPLLISDSYGLEPDGFLQAEEIKFFNLQHGDRPGWKDFKTRRTLDRYREASGIFVESLKPGISLHIHAGLDQFLRTGQIRSIWQIASCNGLEGFKALAKTVNAHSMELCRSEKEFFEQHRPETSQVADFYTRLITRIEKLEESSDSFILRMAWGSGWRGMTGNWLHGSELEAVRRETKLGKKGVPVFPKTRRLAMKDGVPCLPLGWVIVKPGQGKDFYKKMQIIPEAAEEIKAVKPEPPAPKPVDPAKIREEKLEQFRKQLADCDNLPGKIGTYTEKVKAQEDQELQKAMCQELIKKGESLGKKKKFSKALSKGQTWAKNIADLCKDCGVDISGNAT